MTIKSSEMQENRIKDIIAAKPSTTEITIQGWVRAFRSNRFIALNDGSTIKNLQCVVDFENFEETLLKKVTIGAAIKVSGAIVESQGKGQKVEIQVSKIRSPRRGRSRRSKTYNTLTQKTLSRKIKRRSSFKSANQYL